MGRPRSFDEDAVLDKALLVFWAQGFDATSIEDLEAATGLRRASLYGAFGDKQAMFRACLARYAHAVARPWLAALPAGGGGPAVTSFLDSLVNAIAADPARRGCFMVNTAADGQAGEEVAAHLARVRDGFASALAGDARLGADEVRGRAQLAMATMLGLLVLGRAGEKRESLALAVHALGASWGCSA
ncbi:MAG: TetR/AcrR family transcriptional regulator [Alphaproteobacteria bacterium]